MYELDNAQRGYFGLEPVGDDWARLVFPATAYRPESIVYFDGDIIKKHILSTDKEYKELQYHEPTRERVMLLPKTAKGKEQKLSASTLESRTAIGVYLNVQHYGMLQLGHMDAQTTFYNSLWEYAPVEHMPISEQVERFIKDSPANHLEQIAAFKAQKRQRCKFKKGDYFRFKLDRTRFGFGRVLSNIGKLRESATAGAAHGLFRLMGMPALVQLFVFASPNKQVDLAVLKQQPVLPASMMMDNALLYGEYEVFAHEPIADALYDVPAWIHANADEVSLGWGLVFIQMNRAAFESKASSSLVKIMTSDLFSNPSIAFRPQYANFEIVSSLRSGALSIQNQYWDVDLRNPKWAQARAEIFTIFGLDAGKSYAENCKAVGLPLPSELP